MTDDDDGLEEAQGLPNYIRTKPMTDPTADAAKLLPSGCPVPGCPATGDSKPYAGVPTCMQGYAGDPAAYENYIRGCILRGNTRPQPAPPEGEPVLLDPVRQTAISGLAERPKVEDAADDPDPWKRVEHWRKAAFAAEAKLAEREAELGKAYEVIAHTLTPTDCFCGDIEVVRAAHASHAARQQQKS